MSRQPCLNLPVEIFPDTIFGAAGPASAVDRAYVKPLRFTDSFVPVIYRLPLGPKCQLLITSQLETIPLSGDYIQVNGFNANGIEATPNGKWLIIVNSLTGLLYRVDPQSGAAQKNLVPTTIPGGEGLLLDGKTLYVLADEIAVIALTHQGFLSSEVTRGLSPPQKIVLQLRFS